MSPMLSRSLRRMTVTKARQRRARNEMLARSHNPIAPGTLVRADDKHLARLNIIKDLLSRLHYADKDERLILPDPQIVFAFDISNLENGQLAK